MKDNKNELNADVKAGMQKQHFFFFNFFFFLSKVFYKMMSVQPLVWFMERTPLYLLLSYTRKEVMARGLIYKTQQILFQ